MWVDTECLWAREFSPDGFARALLSGIFDGVDRVCAEDYISQGGFGSARTGSETAGLLGLVVWYSRIKLHTDPTLVTRLDRSAALKRLQAAGYRFRSANRHAKDSQALVVSAMKWSVKDLVRSD